MKRITFFIGNGFDINVGLDTRYSNFYKYYLSHYPEDMLAKSIDKNYDLWSDLESGLGEYTANVDDGMEATFWESEEKLENALADYLQSQTERIQISGEAGSVKNFVALVKNGSFLVRITDMTILIEKEFIYGSSKRPNPTDYYRKQHYQCG